MSLAAIVRHTGYICTYIPVFSSLENFNKVRINAEKLEMKMNFFITVMGQIILSKVNVLFNEYCAFNILLI